MSFFTICKDLLGPQESLHATRVGDYKFTYKTPEGKVVTLLMPNMTSQAEADCRADMKMKGLVSTRIALPGSLRRA